MTQAGGKEPQFATRFREDASESDSNRPSNRVNLAKHLAVWTCMHDVGSLAAKRCALLIGGIVVGLRRQSQLRRTWRQCLGHLLELRSP